MASAAAADARDAEGTDELNHEETIEEDDAIPGTSDDTEPIIGGFRSRRDKNHWVCCKIFHCTPSDIALLVTKMVCFGATLSVAVVELTTAKTTHGECMLTAGYSRLGYIEYSESQLRCDLVLYYSMVADALLFASIMIDWIAELKNSIRWLTTQIVGVFLVVLGMMGATAVLWLAFFAWCDTIASVLPMSKHTDSCKQNVENYNIIPEQDYHLNEVYSNTLLQMGLCLAACVCWWVVFGATVWKLRSTLREQQRSLQQDKLEEEQERAARAATRRNPDNREMTELLSGEEEEEEFDFDLSDDE